MGSKARVVLYATDEPEAAAAATGAFERIEQLDAILSDYRKDSELCRLSQHPPRAWIPVSPDLYAVIASAREVSSKTDGAFDITVAPIVALWREARNTGELPSDRAIADAVARTGWQHINLDPGGRKVRFDIPGVRLDPGGIGKGYAAQAALDVLRQSGHPIALVDLGGDLALGDPPPGARVWKIRVSTEISPDSEILLANTCVATSGDAERSVTIDGRTYAHIVDPRSGWALSTRRAATAIDPDGGLADALASAACVMGSKDLADLRLAYPGARIELVAPDE